MCSHVLVLVSFPLARVQVQCASALVLPGHITLEIKGRIITQISIETRSKRLGAQPWWLGKAVLTESYLLEFTQNSVGL